MANAAGATQPQQGQPQQGQQQQQQRQQRSGRRAVVWFRNDLRLRDNAALAAVAERVRAGDVADVVPLYVFDPRTFGPSEFGTPKTGPHRAAFLLESVAALKQSLRAAGSDLLVAVGRPEDVVPSLLEGCGGSRASGGAAAAGGAGGGSTGPIVVTQEEVASEELRAEARVARAIKPHGGALVRVWGSTLYHRSDLPYGPALGDMPDVFTPFKDAVERKCQVRPEAPALRAGDLPLPEAGLPGGAAAADFVPSWEQLPFADGKAPLRPQPHPQAALRFEGGEAAALARLRYYLWDSDRVADYFNTRNGMLGGDYSTKFAPWLANGCLSPRTVYHELKRYEAARGANKSTYWVIFEITWRDFFRFYALKHGDAIFKRDGPANRRLSWSDDPDLWRRWRDGATGLPLVDANMRELAATGWMSNRGRQNVASYLALDAGVDWRRGADLFEHLLLDYDAASNWGNWVAAAGLTGGRVNRFNIAKQARDYDPAGEYVKAWLPELRNVPTDRIFEPWLMSKDEQARCGVEIGRDYPAPAPAARLGRPHAGGDGGAAPARFGGRGSGRGGGRGGGGRGGGGGGGRGGGANSGGGRRPRPRSEFDLYG